MQAGTKPDGAVVYFDLRKRKDLAVRSFGGECVIFGTVFLEAFLQC